MLNLDWEKFEMKLLKFSAIFAILSFVVFATQTSAQTRQSVGASEVNGTFRYYFEGKYKGNFNEIKILALGKEKLRVAFQLVYPFTDGTGGLMVNTGEASGTATIEGDTATFLPDETTGCIITIKFVKRGTIKVTQEGDSDCGFGLNVNSQGTYKKSSSAKPRF
jgi:hypothetical protein